MASYSDWCTGVDRLLKQSPSSTRVAQIDPDALRDAFAKGMSPAEFVTKGVFPLTAKAAKARRAAARESSPDSTLGRFIISSLRASSWLNIFLSLIVLFVGMWGVHNEHKAFDGIDYVHVVFVHFGFMLWGLLLGAAGEGLALLTSIDRKLSKETEEYDL